MNENLKTTFSLMQHNLIALVEEKGTFTDPYVLKVSQELDQMIIQLQKSKLST